MSDGHLPTRVSHIASCKLVQDLVIRYLLALLGSKVGHQVVSLALPHYLGMSYQLVLSLYLHQPESHQFSLKKGLVCSE